jgi:hypothetical protein
MAGILRAALELDDGRTSACESSLRKALVLSETRGGLVSKAAIQRPLGRLLGGQEGARLIATGDDAMRAQGVADLERTTELCCPGCSL